VKGALLMRANVKTAERKNGKRRPQRKIQRPQAVSLRFSPYAWAKLLFLRDVGETEVGGFGLSSAEDLLFVEDVQLVRQSCSWSSVEFDDGAVADYFDARVEEGVTPEACGRIWIHTHPGSSATPSNTDEATFARVFGRNEWAVMFILAQNGSSYARLQFSAGPGGSIELAVSVDYATAFPATESDVWLDEYRACVALQNPPEIHYSSSGAWDEHDWFREAEEGLPETSGRKPERWHSEWSPFDDDPYYYGGHD
jgi:hypothetical protein